MLRTRIGDLDSLLGGGIRRGESVVLVGPPGSGKTTLVLQIAFRLAGDGDRTVFVTTRAEPSVDVVRHASSFRFHDPSRIGREIRFLDVPPDDAGSSVDGFTAAVAERVRETDPALLVVDGFETLPALDDRPEAVRRLLDRLSDLLRGRRCAGIFTRTFPVSGGVSGLASAPFADALVEMSPTDAGRRVVRIHKLRGRALVPGAHAARIGHVGVEVFRRFETHPIRPRWAPSRSRASTGLDRLDRLMSGGPRTGTTTIVGGPSATGKSLVGLRFLEAGMERDEQALLVCLRETPGMLLARGRRIGIELEDHLVRGRLSVLYRSPVELDVDELTARLRGRRRRQGPDRILLDGLERLAGALDPSRRIGRFGFVLANLLTSGHTTALLTVREEEKPGGERRSAPSPRLARSLAENRLRLSRGRPGEEASYRLAVVHMKDGRFDPTPHAFRIEAGPGIVLSSPGGEEHPFRAPPSDDPPRG